jgi:hypothetical protein
VVELADRDGLMCLSPRIALSRLPILSPPTSPVGAPTDTLVQLPSHPVLTANARGMRRFSMEQRGTAVGIGVRRRFIEIMNNTQYHLTINVRTHLDSSTLRELHIEAGLYGAAFRTALNTATEAGRGKMFSIIQIPANGKRKFRPGTFGFNIHLELDSATLPARNGDPQQLFFVEHGTIARSSLKIFHFCRVEIQCLDDPIVSINT